MNFKSPMPHYEKAPIAEALIDIRTELPSKFSFEELQTLGQSLPDYKQAETRNIAHGQFSFGRDVQAVAQQKPWGLVFRNGANTQVAQFQMNGFTFSRLKPYEDWERLRDEARKLWNLYRQLAQPTAITRVAVRYINVFDFPGGRVDLEDYLNVFPQLAESLPRELRDYHQFLLNLQMPQDDLKGLLILNQSVAQPTKTGFIAIVLDIDLSVGTPVIAGEGELWAIFDKLRERKNLYFEAFITDKARELIS